MIKRSFARKLNYWPYLIFFTYCFFCCASHVCAFERSSRTLYSAAMHSWCARCSYKMNHITVLQIRYCRARTALNFKSWHCAMLFLIECGESSVPEWHDSRDPHTKDPSNCTYYFFFNMFQFVEVIMSLNTVIFTFLTILPRFTITRQKFRNFSKLQ